jgi:excisionase family DNA binding protein
MSRDRLLTTQQVAEYLAVPIATIHRWRYVGTGPPAIRVGRHLRFDPDDLRAWIAERRRDVKR